MKIVTYSRVSTDHHEQNPQIQVDEMRRYCELKGWAISEELIDHGFSGSTLNRPALKRLLEMVRRKEVDRVIVLNLSRLFRSLKHLVTTLEEFNSLGVTFVSIKESVDYSTPAGRLFVGVIGSLNEFTREIIRENTVLGLDHARRNGKVLGRPRKHDPDLIRNLREQGLTYRQISVKLSAPLGTIGRVLKDVHKT